MNTTYLKKIKLKEDKIEDMDKYPFNLPVIKNLDKLEFNTPVTFIVGENGSGKSTLIEAIAVAMGLNPEGGNKAVNFNSEKTHSNLYKYLRCVKGHKYPKEWFFLRAETFYNVATYYQGDGILDVDYSGTFGLRSIHKSSHGELFLAALENKLHGNGFYIFDEPEAALSPTRQLNALIEIDRLAQDSQLIIATHSPILMSYPGATIYEISNGEFKKVNYYETEHYKVTKDFLCHTDVMLRELLKD